MTSINILKAFALQEMGLLEVKHGLLQIAESLEFLHNNARLVHRAIAPEVISCSTFFPFRISVTYTREICFELG